MCEQRGRHRYCKLADDEMAHALEAVALIAERRDHMASNAQGLAGALHATRLDAPHR